MDQRLSERTGFLFDGTVDELDPSTSQITAFEEARQVNKLIMIASESAAPPAVRQALASVFTDLYAEGYPAAHVAREPESLLSDVSYQLAYHERYSDRRYYKGTEFADLVEALAQERIRRLFAPNRYAHNTSQIGPEQIQANVQPLSGANANTAVYFGLLQPGDTIMGLNLSHGGHLSHGSPVNISGKLFKVVDYGVDPATGRIDYAAVERIAREHNPRMIVTGASAYPWAIDFARFRQICDSLPRKAYLLADVSHPAGLVVAGLFPNPVGIADVTTFTTHKTLIGPRAAVILTTNESLARRIDRAVFPGLQGGPHMNTIAALAVAFAIALRSEFDELQRTIVENARALAETLVERGLRLAYGGTETHLLLIDLKSIRTRSGVPLNGDVAARILDLAGIVCNKNTIADDTSANFPTGIRLGTPWITQRGLKPDDMRALGGIIADVLFGIETFAYFDGDDGANRGKIRPDVLRDVQSRLSELIARRAVGPTLAPSPDAAPANGVEIAGRRILDVYGRRARAFFAEVTTSRVDDLDVGQATTTSFDEADGKTIATIALLRRPTDQFGLDHFACAIPPETLSQVTWWIDALSSGLVLVDPTDPWAKIDGPVAVAPLRDPLSEAEADALRRACLAPAPPPTLEKPYFVGQSSLAAREAAPARPEFTFPTVEMSAAPPDQEPSEGWTMPRSYGNPTGEHAALQSAAGLIDESALAIFSLQGPDAGRFLDLVTTNDVAFLAPRAAQYTFLLNPAGHVVTDALLYRERADAYALTVPPAAAANVEAWLSDALSGRYLIDRNVPTRSFPSRLTIQRVSQATAPGSEAVTVVGLAGPNAPAVLRALADGAEDRRAVARLRRFTSATVKLAGRRVTVARTSHTGLAQAYEIFAADGSRETVWNAALTRGADVGVKPIGWEAWRAAGITAGISTFGHEIGGPLEISPVEAGSGAEVRVHKPFFVGRGPLLGRPYPPSNVVGRFRVIDPGASPIPAGAPVVGDDATLVGWVTSPPTIANEPVGLLYAAKGALTLGATLTILTASAPWKTPEQPTTPKSAGPVHVEVLPRRPK